MKKNHAHSPIVYREGKNRRAGKVRHRDKIRTILMRINLVTIFTLITFIQVTGKARGQQISLNVKNSPLEEVFKAIERQSAYVFFFPSRIVKDKKPVSVQVKNADFKTVMEKVLEGQGLIYSVSENSVIIKEALPAEKAGVQQADITIRGRVTNGDGKPLNGVTIKLKGAEIGTISDQDGRFAIDVPDDNAVLLVSSIGYIAVQVPVRNNHAPVIRLVDATAQLREITVNTGYEKIKPERFVGSATVIDSTVLQRSVSTDLLSRLDGLAAGLLFNKSGGVQQILLRGANTLNSNYDFEGNNIPANPLIILDDFPYNGNLGNINPNDIESVSILRDAAATSIWGARAGNGVIVITSKRGSVKSRFSVSVNSNVQINTKPDMHYYQRMSSSDFIDVEKTLFGKGFYNAALSNPYRFANSPVVEILNQQKKGLITEAQATSAINALRNFDVNDQYNRYILRNGVSFQNYVNVSGGNGMMGYNLSFGSDNNKTGIKGPGGTDRYTINTGVNFKPINALEFDVNVNYVSDFKRDDNVSSNIAPGGRRTRLYPYARFADENGNHLAIPFGYRMSYVDTVGQGKLLDWHYRPLDELDFASNTMRNNFLRLQAGAKFKFTKWLNLDVKYQYGNQNQKYRNYRDERTFYTRDLINFYTTPGTFERTIPLGGILDQSFNELITHNIRAQLNFSRNWELHSVSGILAAESSNSSFNTTSNRLYGYNDEIITSYPNLDFSNFFPVYTGGVRLIPNFSAIGKRTERFASFLANVNYSYDSRYSLFASARRDGSNLLGVNTNNRWKPLWSVGGRWNISNEQFYRLRTLNNLALRATYGYSGNVSNTISPLSIIKYGSTPNQFNQIYATMQNPPNPDLRWEEVRTLNLGLDFGLLDNRISGSIEWYRKKAVDVITNVPSDPSAGLPGGSVQKNAANLSTRGLDIMLNSLNLNGEVKWRTTLNTSFAKTKVTRYYYPVVNTPTYPALAEGKVIGALYAYKWAGLDPATGDPRGYLGHEISTAYADIFRDSVQYQSYIGSAIPLLFGNMMNTVSYKGIELSFNISFKAKYYFRKPTINYYSMYNSWDSHRDFEKRWQKPGDELNTVVPSMPYPANFDRDQFFLYSEANIEKGDHIRLQDVRLSYDFSQLVSKTPIKSLQLYAFAGNLNYLLWKSTKSGYDPDFPTNAPIVSKTYSIGLRMGL